MGCEKFCKGGINKKDEMITKSLDVSCFPTAKLKQAKSGLGYFCPLGCTCNPNTIEATRNVIDNNGKAGICHRNEFLAKIAKEDVKTSIKVTK